MTPGDLFKNVRVEEMTSEEYHARPFDSVSKTRLSLFAQSPQEYHATYVTKEMEAKDTADLTFGRVHHTGVLERHGEVDNKNCLENTLAVFRPETVPRRDPDIVNDDEDIWIVTMPEPGIVRRSSVWGELDDGRHWHILPDPGTETVIGRCSFADMTFDGSICRAIPDSALSKSGQRRGKAWDQFEEDHEGEVLYRFCDWGRLLSMRRQIRGHGDAHECLFQGGEAEKTLVGECVDTGLEVRCRLDFIRGLDNGVLVSDLKTTRCAAPDPFARDAIRELYHVQTAMIVGMVQHVCQGHVLFKWVAQEKTKTYRVEVFDIEEQLMDIGCAKYTELMRKFERAVSTGVWLPKNYGKTHTIKTPSNLMGPPSFYGDGSLTQQSG